MGDKMKRGTVYVYETESDDAETVILPSDIDNAIWNEAIEAAALAAAGCRLYQAGLSKGMRVFPESHRDYKPAIYVRGGEVITKMIDERIRALKRKQAA